ncbi:hypothetical protein Dimus_007513 [Dionaea muscipula]
MDMEKLPAACAVEWSIELEKGLRSRKPGQSIESITKIGQRLVEWNKGPKLTMAVSNMCGLVPGEDRLFADGILLRLASAFASGDKGTRICIVKVFSSAFGHHGKKGRGHGILLTMSLVNRRELLNRVRVVLDDEDMESRALSLICFGCLAVIAKDAAEIRYAILSSLTSTHVLEVEASLFAAGCISELSGDFAAVFLEMLINIVAAPNTLSVLRLAGTRTFAKMGRFRPLANKSHKVAYSLEALRLLTMESKKSTLLCLKYTLKLFIFVLLKVGSELMQKYPEEEFTTAMLISLSKVAVNSMSLISEQFGLLFSLIEQKTTLRMQAIALKCEDLPSPLRCEALKIVLKVISYMSHDMLLMNMHVLDKLMTLTENRTTPRFISERLLEMQVIVEMSSKLNGGTEVVLSGVSSVPVSRVTSLVCDQVTEVMKLLLSRRWVFEMEKEVKFLLNLLLVLVKTHPLLVSFMLDKLGSVIEQMVNKHGVKVASSIPNSEAHRIVKAGDNNLEMFMIHMYRFFVACLDRLDEAGAASIQVFWSLKHLVNLICQSSLFSCSTHTIYTLLLHSVANWYCVLSEPCTANVQHNPTGSLCNWLEDESLISECSLNMLAEDKWFAYTAGKYAVCTGAWFVGNLIFEKLSSSTQCHIYSGWLRSLAQLSYSERHVQVLFLKEGPSDSVNHVLSGDFIEKLVASCDGLSSAGKILVEKEIPHQMFCFQRWFLALRQKVLEVLLDILKLLGTVSLGHDGLSSSRLHEQTSSDDGLDPLNQMKHLQHFLVRLSSKLIRIVQEYDLLVSSFLDMDSKSLEIISSLASSCSLLAFGSGFTFFLPNTPVVEDIASCTSMGSVNCLHVILIQNLVRQLSHMDSDTSMSLMTLLKADRQHDSFFHLQERFSISSISSESLMIDKACRNAVKEVARLQNESMAVHNEDGLLQVTRDGTQVLLNVIKDWMHVPFQLPKYFFKARCCMGAFLFSSNVDPKNPREPSITQGSHLSLNLCLQLENVPPDLILQLNKIYCILHCKTSFLMRPCKEPSRQKLMDHRAWTTDTMIHMHEKLQRYVAKRAGDSISDGGPGGDHGVVEACVLFETNGTRQGFSTCLLDVSAFPVGSYRIQWHSSCINSHGCYNNLLPLNDGPLFTIAKPSPAKSMWLTHQWEKAYFCLDWVFRAEFTKSIVKSALGESGVAGMMAV